jgi:hypothetical protein
MTTTPQSPDRNAAADVLANDAVVTLSEMRDARVGINARHVAALDLAIRLLRAGGEPVAWDVEWQAGPGQRRHKVFTDGHEAREFFDWRNTPCSQPCTLRPLVYGDGPSPAAALPERDWLTHPQTVESKRQWDAVAHALNADPDNPDAVLAAPSAAAQPERAGGGEDGSGLVRAAMYDEVKRQAAYRGFDTFADMALAYDKLAALNAPPAADGMVVPKSNDGKEQDAFEEWARGQGYAMDTHPIHWLFLDSRTAAARDGWRSALDYVTQSLAAAPRQDGAEGDVR